MIGLPALLVAVLIGTGWRQTVLRRKAFHDPFGLPPV
jgi:hypothetical protein